MESQVFSRQSAIGNFRVDLTIGLQKGKFIGRARGPTHKSRQEDAPRPESGKRITPPRIESADSGLAFGSGWSVFFSSRF